MPIPDVIKQAARDLRKNQTPSEELLWKLLRRKKGALKIYRQKPILVAQDSNNFNRFIIADFYFPLYKTIIEFDGSIHEKEEIYHMDREKEKLLHNLWYKILRFKNEEVLWDIDSVLSEIVASFSS